MKHTVVILTMLFSTVGCSDVPASSPPSTPTKASDAKTAPEGDTTTADPSATPKKSSKSTAGDDSDARKEEKKPVKATVVRTEEEWKKLLTPEQYYVLRQKGTERPFQNKFDHHFEPGKYACAACGQVLFSSDTKFNSGCGWPAFYAAQAGDRVTLTPDKSLGMIRTEVTCSRCDSHLGHIFDDAPQTPTGQRYCINSVSLKFIPAPKAEKVEGEADE